MDLSLLSVNSAGVIGSTVPREIINDPKEFVGQDLNSALLKRGQFRVTFRVPEPQSDEPMENRASSYISSVQNSMQMALTDEGEKRIYVYNVTQEPTEPLDGNEMLKITATFAVLDNPVWLVPALWAATAAIGTIGSWFVIDKVESFSGTAIGSVTILLAAGLTAFILYKTL